MRHRVKSTLLISRKDNGKNSKARQRNRAKKKRENKRKHEAKQQQEREKVQEEAVGRGNVNDSAPELPRC